MTLIRTRMTNKNSSTSVAVAIMARKAEMGVGKSRLAATLGAELTFDIYRHLIAVCAAAIECTDLPATVYFDPEPGDSDVWTDSRFKYALQSTEADLGQRLFDAATESLAQHEGVLLIGTDCPSLTSEILIEAANALSHSDAVIGPSTDGGYYLLGIKLVLPELFKNIDWSTDKVAAQTREVFAKAQLKVHNLPVLNDIDEQHDWNDYLASPSRATAQLSKNLLSPKPSV